MMNTNRLKIVAPATKYIDQYLEIRNSDFVLKYNPMPILTYENALCEISEMIQNAYFIINQTSNQLIGVIHLEKDQLRFDVNSIMISYYLHENYCQQGYMYEALFQVIELLLNKYDIITARVFFENIASRKLLEKLQFEQEGIIKKCVRYRGIIYDDVIYSKIKEAK